MRVGRGLIDVHLDDSNKPCLLVEQESFLVS
jgi:hypothetical protein